MKKRSLFAAVAMLVVSAVLLTSATYAWFTAGGNASIDGLEITTIDVSSGVMLRAKNTGWVGKLDAGNATKFAALFPTGDTTYPGKLPTDGSATKFTPVSSQTGETFVSYTRESDGSFAHGTVSCGDYYMEYQFDVGVVKGGDHVYAYPQLVGPSSGNSSVNTVRVALLREQEASGGSGTEVVPLAVWSSDSEATQAIAQNTSGGSAAAYDLSALDDKNGTTAYVVDSSDGTVPSGALVTQTCKTHNSNTVANVVDLGAFATEVSGSTPTVQHLIVRVWIEGQDAQCAPSQTAGPGASCTVKWVFNNATTTV